MKISSLTLFCVMACGAASVQAASFDCVAPVFPAQSTSSEGVRRVEKLVKHWRACNQKHADMQAAPEVVKLNEDVEARLGKWLDATRSYAQGQDSSQKSLTRIERDKTEYGTWVRNSQVGMSADRNKQ